MTHSDSIKELATALAKSQGAIAGAKKDSTNPHFKSAYADLASIWEACRKPLTDHGLAVAQSAETSTDGRVGITTVLMHNSGEWMTSTLVIKPTKDDPQGVGSAITYARRYALAAMVGVAPEDDDGNAASAKDTTRAAAVMPPEGYDKWVLFLEEAADDGLDALKTAFMQSKQQFIDFRVKHDNVRHEALKARTTRTIKVSA